MQITGTLKLERFDKDFRLLERRVQPMRSWTKGLMDILYEASASIGIGAPWSGAYDIDSTPRAMAMFPNVTGARNWVGHGLVAAPPGFSTVASREYAQNMYHLVQGCDLGIQVGNDGTVAVAPTNRRLARRIGHGTRVADGGDVTFEAYDVNDDVDTAIITNDNQQRAQGFVPLHDFRCSSVELKLWKTLAPAGPLTVEIRAPGLQIGTWNGPSTTVLATGTIASAALGASPGAFVACVFGTPVDLYAGHKYFIVLHSAGIDGANYFNWRYDNVGATYDHDPDFAAAATSFVGFCTTTDAWAANFTRNTGSCTMFRVIGRSIGELEYGGCELVHRVTADPNDAFDIRRFFYNRSGAAIDVAEVGINALFMHYLNIEKILVTQIARDVVGPAVTVANTEILLVTYTPAIIV